MTRILVDTHVHLYGVYDFERALHSAYFNLNRLDANAFKAIVLTEKSEFNFWGKISDNELKLKPEFSIKTLQNVLELTHPNWSSPLYIFPGTQIETKEKIEILSLFARTNVISSLSSEDAIKLVLNNGAIAAIPWSPGKWLGRRRTLITALLSQGCVYCSDSSLRSFIPEPLFFSGSPLVCGTDPLPFEGEEDRIGTYATLIEFSHNVPIINLTQEIKNQTYSAMNLVGTRNSISEVIIKLIKNKLSKSRFNSLVKRL